LITLILSNQCYSPPLDDSLWLAVGISVERVPVEGEASEAEIKEEEVVVPVSEEEVVVHKRPVLKEEVRIRKDVVEETEVVEEDVRREEVEVEDDTKRRGGL
jgi:uncharacterized protein (TIGR02271 family)